MPPYLRNSGQTKSPDLGRHSVAISEDQVLGTKWKIVVDCDHPEWPAHMVKISNGPSSTKQMPNTLQGNPAIADLPIVRAGEKVKLWKKNDMVRIETFGFAQESGRKGERIKIRPEKDSAVGQNSAFFLLGIVQEHGAVEILE
ncbi:flagella basal body P-ring formation protein FlgA [Granulicella sp. dw_53]|uniref:flagella basal body P-ring formation protein FlgA n=1 Tax=Granulicella sp. dw_53 TaxID=2719792 RepID=UPI001BD3DA68|nr:flagella basal body P-ring formation protein FlgA [Granulicella sp. dw_53]